MTAAGALLPVGGVPPPPPEPMFCATVFWLLPRLLMILVVSRSCVPRRPTTFCICVKFVSLDVLRFELALDSDGALIAREFGVTAEVLCVAVTAAFGGGVVTRGAPEDRTRIDGAAAWAHARSARTTADRPITRQNSLVT